jgi:hypothetical protein
MEVRVEKKLATKENWSKVSNQKRLNVVECWLTQGKGANEKEASHPAHPMDKMTNLCSHGGWFTLAMFLVFPLLWVLWFIFDWQGFMIILRTALVL